VDNSTGEITLPIRGEGPQLLAEAVRRLDAAGIRLADIALRRPTLDEVFLQLTGRETEPEPEPTTRRGRRRRSREKGERGHHRPVSVAADVAIGGPGGPNDRRSVPQPVRGAADDDRRLPGGVPVPSGRDLRRAGDRARRPGGLRVLVDLGRDRVGDQEPRVRPSGQLHLDLPLTFASGAFVGIALMPGWLQAWARNNPVTIWSNTIRAYTIGGRLSAYVGETVLGLTIKSGIWIAIILAIFMPLSVRIYRRT
jgi:hypothetical protein